MTTINNLSNPGQPLSDGDDMEIVQVNGGIERRKYWAPAQVVDSETLLAHNKVDRSKGIKDERDRRKLNGVLVRDKWIHSDTYSRTQWMAMVMMGAGIPSIEWTTMDGTSITTSQTLAGQVLQAYAQLDAAVFGHAKALIEQVNASTDPSSIDITTGWPATYEGAVWPIESTETPVA